MSHPKLSRYDTAIEESLQASSRRVLPALRAGGRYSDSQEMAGAVGAAARGAMEAGERGGGSAASRFSRGAGHGRGLCGFSQGEGDGRGGVMAGISSRPTLLSLILRRGYLRRFSGG